MPRDINQTQLLTNQALVLSGAPNTFGQNFPIGRGWYKTRIRIGIAVTIGTGAGAAASGLQSPPQAEAFRPHGR